MNHYSFDGRVALVTGGASGMGAATVDMLIKGGANVVTFDLHRPDGGGLWVEGDISQSGHADRAVARAVDEFGRLDILVNAAGIGGSRPLRTAEVSDDEWLRQFAVNCHGTFWFCRAAAPVMIEQGYGRIVNITSMAGKEGIDVYAAYSGAKGAVIAFTKAIGKDLAKTGVLVNAVAPGLVETPMNEQTTDEQIEFMLSRIPMGRKGRPEEVAALICWLASEDLAFSTGSCYDFSGGRGVY